MPGTLSKAASREAWAAWLRGWRLQAPQWPSHLALHWTHRVALIAIVCAFVFAWGFLHLVLMLIFAPASR